MNAEANQIPVTVVIPSFRARNSIVDAIESVRQQTILPCEVIIVDDASDDGTPEVLHLLQKKYPPGWLKLVELPKNVGAGEARNAGWNCAQGVCIAFLDSDDCWHPRKLELQWKQFSLDPLLVLCGHGFRFPWDPEVDLTESTASAAKPVLSSNVLWRNPFVTPSVMIRRDIPLRFCPGKRYMEDHLLWMEIVLSGYSCKRMVARLATISKPQFGSGGLSAQLWAMEKGDLDNYWRLFSLGHISSISAVFFSAYSLAKYVRRLAIVGMRRIYQSQAKNCPEN